MQLSKDNLGSNIVEQVKEVVNTVEAFEFYCESGLLEEYELAYKGRCPFSNHKGKEPRFRIDKSTGNFFCYKCSHAGDVIDFVSKLKGVGRVQAAKKLANDFNIGGDFTLLNEITGKDRLVVILERLNSSSKVELEETDVIKVESKEVSEKEERQLVKAISKYDYEDVVILGEEDNESGPVINLAESILHRTGTIVRIAYFEIGEELSTVVREARRFIKLVEEGVIIDSVELLISELSNCNDEVELPEQIKIIIPLLAELDKLKYNRYINQIRDVIKEKTGSKSTLGSKQELITMINEERRKSQLNGVNQFNPTKLAKEMIADEEGKGNKWAYVSLDTGGLLYFYDSQEGYWESTNSDYLKASIRQTIRNHNPNWETSYKVGEVMKSLQQGLIMEGKDKFDPGVNPNLNLINVKNGMLDWKNGELLEHDSSYYSLFQIPIEYDDNATCPKWEAALKDWVPDKKSRKFLQEFAGYCLIPDTSYHKALILYGNGSNGKSTFLDVLERMYGVDNCLNKQLHQLSEKFETIDIKDKLININSDIDADCKIDNFGIIKSIISGDSINGRELYKSSLDFKPICRLIFSANNFPEIRDTSDGSRRRFEVVGFPNQFKQGSPGYNPNLKEELLNELPGIFNWCLVGLERLKAQKQFTISENMQLLKSQLFKELDTVKAFLEDWIKKHLNKDEEVSTAYLFRKYKQYCEESGFKHASKNKLSRRLNELGLKRGRYTLKVCNNHENFECEECSSTSLTTARKRGFKLI